MEGGMWALLLEFLKWVATFVFGLSMLDLQYHSNPFHWLTDRKTVRLIVLLSVVMTLVYTL